MLFRSAYSMFCSILPTGSMSHAFTRLIIGAGKVGETAEMARALEADIVVFDNGLSPIQLRNLTRELVAVLPFLHYTIVFQK